MKHKPDDFSKQYARWGQSNPWSVSSNDQSIDQSRKHAKLLDKIVLWAVIVTAIYLAAFIIFAYYRSTHPAHPTHPKHQLMPEPIATLPMVKHIVGELFNINAVPQFVELRELNIKSGSDMVKLRQTLLKVFKKDVALSVDDCVGSITDKLNAA